MKHIIFLLFISCSAIGQTNELAISDFLNAKFGDTKLSDIKATKGNQSELELLFDESFTYETGEEPDYWIEFDSPSYCFLFQDGEKMNGVISNYQLTNLKLKDNSKSLFIKGIQVKVGDNISQLGNVNILTYGTGVKKIVYKLGSEVIRISFDQNTSLITEIVYEYYNT